MSLSLSLKVQCGIVLDKTESITMKVMIDGKEVEANDVTIMYDEAVDLGPDGTGDAHITANSEGIVIDIFDKCGNVYVTGCREPSDLLEVIDG